MTNKLPEVGKRYNLIADGEYDLITIYKNYCILIHYADEEIVTSIHISEFWKYAQEIPETNKIERDCPAEESAEEWNTTDIKEEKDIWKPMAEITMADSYLFRFDNTKAIMALTQGINEFNGFRNRLRDALIKESDIEACTLTDFINDYERLKADVAAIKKQLDL